MKDIITDFFLKCNTISPIKTNSKNIYKILIFTTKSYGKRLKVCCYGIIPKDISFAKCNINSIKINIVKYMKK